MPVKEMLCVPLSYGIHNAFLVYRQYFHTLLGQDIPDGVSRNLVPWESNPIICMAG